MKHQHFTARLRPWYEPAIFVICAGLVVWQLFVPPALGVADTRDSAKLIGRYCLGPAFPEQNLFFDYVTFQFSGGPQHCWNSQMGTSAHVPLAAALVGMNAMLPSGGMLDVRLLGAIYALCFLAAIAGALQLSRRAGVWPRLLLPPAAILVFVNATYVPWLNSFYFDTASFVFLLMSAASVSRLVAGGAIRTRDYVAAAVCVLLFAASKSQHSLLALMAIPCLWRPPEQARYSIRLTRSVCCLIIVVAIGWTLRSSPPWYSTTNVYNALFYRALPYSSDPAADLAEFGIGTEYLPSVGHHAFEPDSPLDDPPRALYLSGRLTPWKLVPYYASHPRVTWQVFLQAMTEGSLLRARMTIGHTDYRLGNYALQAGYPPGTQSHFLDGWTQFKAALFAWRPRVYMAYALGLLAALWALISRKSGETRKRAALLGVSLTGMILLAPFLALFDGVDTGRHLFLFNALLDIAACAIAAAI